MDRKSGKIRVKTMIRRRFLHISGIVALSTMLSFGAAPATAAEPDEFIRDMGREAINSLTGRDMTTMERHTRFREILQRAFDMRTIARFTLGRYWRIASKKERDEYVALFEDFVIQAYAARFKDYHGHRFEVGKVHDINEKDRLVVSEIVQPKGPPVRVNWRVREKNGLRIIDVVVEGISMGITQRDEFASGIRNNGGQIEGLLSPPRKKTGPG